MRKPIVHLVCNAHLDPVWQWEWEEGACEALSTFRTAADLCEESESFVFNHNEVILYKWIEEYEPDLFDRIRRLAEDSGRDPDSIELALFQAPPQPEALVPLSESGVARAVLGLPQGSPGEVLAALDSFLPLLDAVGG